MTQAPFAIHYNQRLYLETIRKIEREIMSETGLRLDATVASQPTILRPTSAIRLIAVKEIAENLTTYKIFAASLIMLALLLLSAFLMASDYRTRLANWSVNQAAQRDSIIGGVVEYRMADGRFLHSVGLGHDPPTQIPQSLSAIVKGLDGEVDRPVGVHQQIAFGAQDSEAALSAGSETPDTFFMMKLLVSLLALMFSLGAVTREKETGGLRAILAQPISRRNLILGKAIGASLSLLLPLTIACAAELIYLKSLHGIIEGPEAMARTLLIFATGALYGIVFIFIGLFISTVTAQTKSAIVIALLGWGTIVFVLPNTAVLIADLLSPAPSYNQLAARLREAREQIIQPELQAAPGAKSIFDLPNSREVIFRTIDMDRQLTDDFLAGKLRKVNRAQLFSALSPAGALLSAQSNLAATGAGAYGDYLQRLRLQRDAIIDSLKRGFDMPRAESAKLIEETRQKATSQQRQPEPFGSSLRSTLLPFASLLVWASVFAVATFWRFEKYDVR
jgi:ABC-type transport system involved in multi-copper enzyme maturation permease subunit